MKISVLLINYNHERFLRQTLDSVVSQDYPDFEIVVADDCSTDSSREIIKQYADRFPGRFVLAYRDRNGGITQNAITGFQRCTGELIAYLDGDDLYLPGKLSEQAKLFADPEVVLAYHAAEIFDSETGQALFVTNRKKREDVTRVEDIITKMGIQHTSSIMVRRSACPAYGFHADIPHVSDWLFEIEVAMCGKVARLDGVFTRYRKHPNSASAIVRTFEGEFEQVLDIVEEKYGSRRGILEACALGRARFLAGQAFRRFPSDRLEARQILKRCKTYAPKDFRYRMAYAATFLPIGNAALKAKYLIKRYVG